MRFLFTPFLTLFLTLVPVFSFASTPAEILREEFQRIKTWTETVEPDGIIGGIYKYVEFDGYLLMFSKEYKQDHDTIRFFLGRPTPIKDFTITYHYSRHILKGRTIIRRFIGPEPTGWRNDTIDYNTGEYLGSQGVRSMRFQLDEQKILSQWKIQWIE